MALLEIKDIHKSFGNLNVLNGMDLTVNKGDVIAILGPSGSGKTTLLRCINYLETAYAGTMIFNGKSYDLSNTSKKDIAQLRKHTGFVFQNYNLFANKTALQNVPMYYKLYVFTGTFFAIKSQFPMIQCTSSFCTWCII